MPYKEDFGVEAEAHYYATAHGKSACDGIGAILKREAKRKSLQIVNGEPILTPEALFQFAKSHLKETDVFFFSKDDHEQIKQKLKERFDAAKPIPGIQKNHCFIPSTGGGLRIKRYSASTNEEVFPKKRRRKQQPQSMETD